MKYPWRLKGKPYEVQSKTADAAHGKVGFGFLLQMGLGKSAVTLNEFLELSESGIVEHIVVIAPNSLKGNWKGEVEKWGVDIDVVLWPKKPKFSWVNGKCTYRPLDLNRRLMWVFNIESVLFAGGEELGHFIDANKCYVALDESSKIKNFNSRTAKTLIAMSPRMTVRRILTGTPMSQSVMDLYAQLRFIGELVGVNPYAFRNRYAVMGGYMGKKVVNVQNAEELQGILARCSFQAKKKDWTDLPPKVYQTRRVEMTKLQQDAYNEMRRNFLLMLSDATVITAPMVITQLSKLQQISRGFIIDENGVPQVLVESKANPCIAVVHEIMDEIQGKLIIFAFHKHSMSALYTALYQYNPARLEGGMKDHEVDAEKAKFNNDSTCRIIISQLGVGGIGHTLLGQKGKDRCSTVLYYENTFSKEKRDQSEDRNHRHGQDETCVYIDLVTSPVDVNVTRALQHKTSIVEAVMAGARRGEL